MTYLKTQLHDAPLFWDNKFFLIFRYAIYESSEFLFMQWVVLIRPTLWYFHIYTVLKAFKKGRGQIPKYPDFKLVHCFHRLHSNHSQMIYHSNIPCVSFSSIWQSSADYRSADEWSWYKLSDTLPSDDFVRDSNQSKTTPSSQMACERQGVPIL